LPGKDLTYKGPVLLKAICNQVVLDAEQQGLSITYDQAYKVVASFFLNSKSAMKRGETVNIEPFGIFGISPAEKKKRLKRDYYNMLVRKYTSKKRNKRRTQMRNLRTEWKKHCEKLKRGGLKPWRFEEWKTVFKKRKMRKIKKLSIEKII